MITICTTDRLTRSLFGNPFTTLFAAKCFGHCAVQVPMIACYADALPDLAVLAVAGVCGVMLALLLSLP